jgi:hypothetical protein
MCLAGNLFAQLYSEEFYDLSTWLGKYYCEQNNVEWISSSDPRYSELKKNGEGMFSLPPLTLINDMYRQVKVEFPMDASLQATVVALDAKKNASYLEVAQRYGYSSWNELWNNVKKDPALQEAKIWEQQSKIDNEYTVAYSAATNTYYKEFNKRYETAVIEAIKRIQDNASAMKSEK